MVVLKRQRLVERDFSAMSQTRRKDVEKAAELYFYYEEVGLSITARTLVNLPI